MIKKIKDSPANSNNFRQINVQGISNSPQQQSSPSKMHQNQLQGSPSLKFSPILIHALPPLPPQTIPTSKPTCDLQNSKKNCPSVPVRRSSLDRHNRLSSSTKNSEHIREMQGTH